MSASRLPNCAYCGGFLSCQTRILYEFPLERRRFYTIGWHARCTRVDIVFCNVPGLNRTTRDLVIAALRKRGSGRVLPSRTNAHDGIM